MILVKITAAGVGEVAVEALTDRAEDLDLALWPIVREELDRLDGRLRREGPLIVGRFLQRQQPA